MHREAAPSAVTCFRLVLLILVFIVPCLASAGSSTPPRTGLRNSDSEGRLEQRYKATLDKITSQFEKPQAVYTVTSAADFVDDSIDDGVFFPETFRSAIENVNFYGGPSMIVFDNSISIIQPTYDLPNLIGTVHIDGTGGGTSPVILDGSLVTDGPSTAEFGLFASTGGHIIDHLEIRNYPDGGVGFGRAAGGCQVRRCIIHDNGGPGINVTATDDIVVGGLFEVDRNYIYGNTGTAGNGVAFTDAFGSGCNYGLIANNYIGTPDGNMADSNSRYGIHMTGSYNYVGANVISGNNYGGIYIGYAADIPNTGNIIEDNIIGLNVGGTDSIPNRGDGIQVNYSQGDTIRANVIGGNGSHGIEFARSEAHDAYIGGNFIGTDINGTTGLGNGSDGILVRGKHHWIDSNLVCANQGNGITGACDSSTFTTNFSGYSPAAGMSLGNELNGMTIQGWGNVVGGSTADLGNCSSGNGASGLAFFGFSTEHNRIENNYFGLDRTFRLARPNTGYGISLGPDISNNQIISNVISANLSGGISMVGNATFPIVSNSISDNVIGLEPVTFAPLGNGGDGIYMSDANSNFIGDIAPGNGNLISSNFLSGVYINKGDDNTVILNSIYNNGDNGIAVVEGTGNGLVGNFIFENGGLGIDLGDDGVTANDADDSDNGPNNLVNYPVLDSIVSALAQTTVYGSLMASPNTLYLVYFYFNRACDPSMYGEGESLLGSTVVITDGSGHAQFSSQFGLIFFPGVNAITMLSSGPGGNTSEFSSCYWSAPLSADSADIAVSKSASSDTVSVTDVVTYTITVQNNGPSAAEGTAMIDTLPSGFSYVDAQVTSGGGTCSDSGGVVTCLLGDMPVSDLRQIEITAEATTLGTTVNYAAAGSGTFDPNVANNVDTAGVLVESVTDVDEVYPGGNLPHRFSLSANYPNPFNPSTTIEFALPTATHVKLEILNILAQTVRTLVDRPMSAGTFRLDWNGRDEAGHTIASGVYFYRLSADGFTESKKMVLLK